MTEENKESLEKEDSLPEENTQITQAESDAPKKKFYMKIPSFKKKASNTSKEETETMTLKEAYNMLHIEHYPPTNEEIRIAYYREEYKIKDFEEPGKKERLILAKETILSNISINPFAKEYEQSDEIIKPHKDVFAGLKEKTIRKNRKTSSKKKSISQIIGESSASEDTISIEPEEIHTSKKGVIRFVVVMALLTGILYFSFQKEDVSTTEPAVKEEPASAEDTEKKEASSNHPYINMETAVYLAQKDGITLKEGVLYPAIENITDFTSNQNLRIPGVNIYYLTREFVLHNQNASIRIKNSALYKYSETNNKETAYKKITDWTSYTIEDICLDGEWTGECIINNKYTLEANNITLSLTKNGYLTGEYSFFPESEQTAMLIIEGCFNKESNEFTMYGKEWIKRPSLFVTPKLVGYYNPVTDKLESDAKYDDTARFSFYKAEAKHAVINKQTIKHLLKDGEATYKTSTDSHIIPLSQLEKISSFSVTDLSEDICSITYKASLDRDIVDYAISGKAKFYKSAGMWLLEEHSAEATFLGINLAGTYTGTEIIDEKEYYSTYKIYPTKEENVYTAYATLKPGKDALKKTEEVRSVTFMDKGIRMQRVDVLNHSIIGEGTVESYMDYTNDAFVNKSSMSLHKTSEQYE